MKEAEADLKKIRDNEIYEAMTIVDLDSQFSKPVRLTQY